MKTLNLNNAKRVALSLLVAVFAIGFSAFKSSTTKVPAVAYVQTGINEYSQIPWSSYNDGLCQNISDKPCAFVQDEADTNNHGTTLTETEARAIATLQASPEEGMYNP